MFTADASAKEIDALSRLRTGLPTDRESGLDGLFDLVKAF